MRASFGKLEKSAFLHLAIYRRPFMAACVTEWQLAHFLSFFLVILKSKTETLTAKTETLTAKAETLMAKAETMTAVGV